jgi:hypothetical protein
MKNEEDRKEVYILSEEIANLHYVAPKVRNADLVPCITTTGRVSVWARTTPDPNDRLTFGMFSALARAGEEARKRWVLISWDTGSLTIEEPMEPIEEEPRWPTGQPLDEIYEIAIRPVFIDSADHPVIRRCNTVRRGT